MSRFRDCTRDAFRFDPVDQGEVLMATSASAIVVGVILLILLL